MPSTTSDMPSSSSSSSHSKPPTAGSSSFRSKHRRSFSGIRNTFGLGSSSSNNNSQPSPSLPPAPSSSSINPPPATPSLSPMLSVAQKSPSRASSSDSHTITSMDTSTHDRRSSLSSLGLGMPFSPSSNHPSKGTLPNNIRSLRSKFSFGSPAVPNGPPVSRSASYGSLPPSTTATTANGNGSSSTNGSGLLGKFPFGTLSRSNKHKSSGSVSQVTAFDLVSPFSAPPAPSSPLKQSLHLRQQSDDDCGPVMQISAFPPSPGSIMSDQSLAAQSSGTERRATLSSIATSIPPSPSPSTASAASGYYPPMLGKGLPRSPTHMHPPSSPLSPSRSSTDTFLAPPAVNTNLLEERAPSPLRSPHLVVERRTSRVPAFERSRISEVTEPDSSFDVSRPTSEVNPDMSLAIDELSSEGQISRDLLYDHSSASLLNLRIPAIPKSDEILELDQVPSPLPNSENGIDSRDSSTEQYDDDNSDDDEFVSAPPSARASLVNPLASLDPALNQLLSPHRFGGVQEGEILGSNGDSRRHSLRASASSDTPLTSTPLKRLSGGAGEKRLSRDALKPLTAFDDDDEPTTRVYPGMESPTAALVARRSIEGSTGSSPRRPSFALDPNPSPTPTPFAANPLSPNGNGHGGAGRHRRRESVTQIQVPPIRPSHARNILGDKPPVAGTKKDYGALSAARRRASGPISGSTSPLWNGPGNFPSAATAFDKQQFSTPEPQSRPASRVAPRTIGPGRADSPVMNRPYSSMSSSSAVRKRTTVDEVFGSGQSTRGAGPARSQFGDDDDDYLEQARQGSLDPRRFSNRDEGRGSRPLRDVYSPTPSELMRPGSARGDLDAERFGSSALGDYHGGPEHLRRPHTALSTNSTRTSLSAARRGGEARLSADSFYSARYSPHISADIGRPESVSGFTSSTEFQSYGRPASSTAFNPSSPVSSGRTAFSSSQNNAKMSAAQERFELEKDALLIALAQARGNATELQEENARLQTRNKELMSYTLSLENKVSDLQRMLAERTPTFETPYSARVARRRSPLAFSSPSLREAAAAELVGLSSIDSRASEFDATPPLSAPPHIAVMVPSPAPPKADLVDESFRPPPSPRPPPATKSFPDISRSPPSQPAPQKRGHRHTPSDASSIMPQISTTMSMLMNEQGPNDDDPSSTRFSLHTDSDGFAPLGDNHHDADADDDDDDVLFDPASSYKFHSNVTSPGRVGNSLLGASTATARQHSNHLGSSLGPGFAPGQERLTDESFFMKTPSRFGSRGMAGKTTSPTESSFALASPPASPGSLVLRTEDEIHLDDLMSLHDGDSD